MRLLLWGIAAAALLATEPGKRLQRKAVETFKDLKGKACGLKAQFEGEQEQGKEDEAEVGADGKPSKEENREPKNGNRKLRAVAKEQSDQSEDGEDKQTKNHEAESDQSELEASRVAMKESNERHPEMGSEENEDEAEEPGLKEGAEDEGEDSEKSGDEDAHGIDQKKAEELVEKLNAKPSAPEDELKSA